ncbi:MAG: MarR family winged helix-turn-helix transcriptional regulator [Burkholderiales bacterium]
MARRIPYTAGIAFLLRDTYGAFAREFQQALAEAGITMSMFFFLQALARRDGLSQRELMDGAGLMQPATSSALKEMERLRLISRETDPQDARVVRFYMTAKARSLFEKRLLPAGARLRERALVDFTAAELQTLRELLLRMKANLDKEATLSVAEET